MAKASKTIRTCHSFSVSVYDSSVRKWERDAEFVTRRRAWEICCSEPEPVKVTRDSDETVVYSHGCAAEADLELERERTRAAMRGEYFPRLWEVLQL